MPGSKNSIVLIQKNKKNIQRLTTSKKNEKFKITSTKSEIKTKDKKVVEKK